MNNVTIKLLKLVLGGSNLFRDKSRRAKALFAGDISCLKPRTVSWGMSVSPTRFSLLSQDGRATEELFTDGSLTDRAEFYFFLSNKPQQLTIPATSTLQLCISKTSVQNDHFSFLGHTLKLSDDWFFQDSVSLKQCLQHSQANACCAQEKQFYIIRELLPCLLSCFRRTPLLRKTTCQNNVIITEIGSVLLLQHYNRLPLVVKSRHPHRL